MRPARPGWQHYSHCRRAHEEEEDVDAFVNPLAPPPAVVLSLGEGKTLRGISLGSQPLLESVKVPADQVREAMDRSIAASA